MLHRTLLCFALVSGLGLSSAAAAGAAAPSDVLKVTLDQAKIAKVPTGTTTLVVGNPSIADVTMLKGGVGMVVTGKGYGETNLVAIDAQGNILDEKQIEVTPTRSIGEDEVPDNSVAHIRSRREAFARGCPGGKMSSGVTGVAPE